MSTEFCNLVKIQFTFQCLLVKLFLILYTRNKTIKKKNNERWMFWLKYLHIDSSYYQSNQMSKCGFSYILHLKHIKHFCVSKAVFLKQVLWAILLMFSLLSFMLARTFEILWRYPNLVWFSVYYNSYVKQSNVKCCLLVLGVTRNFRSLNFM